MTPICSEHAALLRAVAKKPDDKDACRLYSDWLQERGNIGWLIVTTYHPYTWPVKHAPNTVWGWKRNMGSSWVGGDWRLPWLEGFVTIGKFQNFKIATQWILKAYANGEAK